MFKKQTKKQLPEFRKDLVSEDWILIAPGRRHRVKLKKSPAKKALSEESLKDCIFEDPQKSGNSSPILWYPRPGTSLKKAKDFSSWFVQVIPNKYPLVAISSDPVCSTIQTKGLEQTLKGVGFHEVIITRDHFKTFDKMSIGEAELVIRAYQARYQVLMREPCVNYIFIYHNQGKSAGATVAHPHSQLVAMPVIDPDISRSLAGSRNYFLSRKKCIHCTMLEWEMKKKKRIIYKNKHFISLVPFAPRLSYETRIYPLVHAARFEEITDEKRFALADSLKDALARIAKALDNPDFNFFIHTAPIILENGFDDNEHYHWHVEILPRVSALAGLELGAGIEAVVVSPEEAAEDLRKAI